MLYAAMPVIAAVIGFVTKIIAIRMMFQPLKFVGVPPYLGWQGIIPSKAGIMAGIMCDTLTRRLIQPAEVFGKLDPKRVAQEIEPPLLNAVEEITREVMGTYKPGLWESLPLALRKKLIQRIQNEAPAVIEQMMREMQGNIGGVFDLRDMMVTTLTRDKELLNRIFQQAGRGEFRFIRNSGIYFGFGIGCIQALAWAFTHSAWIMPLFGGFVGWFSDWMALKMVFRPREPKRYLGLFTWQGLFLRRQQEVAAEYGALIAQEVLTAANIIEAALRGPLSDRLFSLVQKHVYDMLDEQAGIAQPLVILAVGSQRYLRMKQDIAAHLIERLPVALKSVEQYADDAMDVRNTLVSRMKQMTPEEFEGVLRPVFEQDEWKLIAVGAILGFLVGELQVHLILQ
ncbi:MAG: DUF445 domain-containing protein [Nevskiaceae bacterium]|nr:MAG: DUF445 domain-containing protein [Nevskiaceae bacterium]